MRGRQYGDGVMKDRYFRGDRFAVCFRETAMFEQVESFVDLKS